MAILLRRGLIPSTMSTPIQLFGANLVFWYKADIGVTIDGSSNVSQWNDQSANAYHLVQSSSGQRPPYRANALNGMPTIEFTTGITATGQLATSGGDVITQFENLQTMTLFFVIKLISVSNTLARYLFVSHANDDGNAAGSLLEDSGAGRLRWYDPLGKAFVTASTGSWFEAGVICNEGGANNNVYLNNVSGGAVSDSLTFFSGALTFGINNSGGNGTNNYQIAEVFGANVAASSDQRTKIQGYFQSRWGV